MPHRRAPRLREVRAPHGVICHSAKAAPGGAERRGTPVSPGLAAADSRARFASLQSSTGAILICEVS
jgi:hypothetical protein